ncbi:MAG TPA: AAA family ATPase [Chthonomonadaceae bacterium]|nr:AAA family ATPase [Chthonomonadaceae bacterium]
MVAQRVSAHIAADHDSQSLDQLCLIPMPVSRFLPLAIRITSAVADLHRNYLIHKDIKPANIRVNLQTGAVHILDSAISTHAPREQSRAQHPHAIQGTLAYMSPEQTGRMNRMLDYRTDLYSLGVTFYEMLTGQLPFQADTPLEWVYSHIAQTPLAPNEVVPEMPALLSAMVMRLLAKEAEHRYQSAAGLQYDLERCWEQWQATGQIASFTLAERDKVDRLQIPQKLYGREREVADLLGAFDRMVAAGAPEFVLVSGYSGIGKSSVVHELHGPAVRERGFFLSGKFDQYKRDIPYATLSEAVRGLIQQILAGNEIEVTRWKQRLEAALEGHGQIIIGLIPQVELILGPQPPLPSLPPLEAKARFQRVFGRFLGVFADAKHPLALFLDDLQWADPASLDLLEYLLTHPETRHLLVVGAYRDNEVSPAHPLIRTVEAIRKACPPLEICLGPLDRPSLSLLVTDTLHCTLTDAEPLVTLVLEKTAGNPFFSEQFLQTLYHDGLLWFDHASQRWHWDPVHIRAANVTNNVVELMADQISRLDSAAQEALKFAACIGNRFDLVTLAHIMDQSLVYIIECLHSAVGSGLLLLSGSMLEHASDTPATDDASDVEPNVTYGWLHDRVQQAAYSLIPTEDLSRLHLAIGRSLRGGASDPPPCEGLFEVVNHLNAAADLISSPGERLDLAELNLMAGRKARDAAAFSSALAYLSAGQGLLSDESWKSHYDLTYAMALERARCEWTCGHLDAAQDQITTLRNHARGRIHQAEVYGIQTELHNTRGNVEQALQTILIGCREFCDLELDVHPTPEALRAFTEQTWKELGERSIEDLLQLPAMADPEMQAVMAFLSASLPIAYFTDPNMHDVMCCHIVSLSLRYGNSPFTMHGYACFGAMLGRLFEMWDEGYRFGQVALNLLERHGLSRGTGVIYFVTGGFIHFWVRPIYEALSTFRKSLDTAMEAGDINTVCIAANQIVALQFAQGDTLAHVSEEAEGYLEITRQAKHLPVHSAISGIHGCVQQLRGNSPAHFPSLEGLDLDEAAFEANLKALPTTVWGLTYWAYKALVKLLAGDLKGATAAAREGATGLGGGAGLPQEAEFCFYASLALAAYYEQAPPEEQAELLATLLAYQEQHRFWQKHGPMTFSCRYALLSAEIARIQDQEMEAMRRYEAAVQAAREHGFVHIESIANERAGRFYQARGFETVALAYLREAHSGYARWGAEDKVRYLEHEFPTLAERKASASTTTMALQAGQLDAMAAVKASQAISGQIVFSNLLETLMQTVIEHAGAQRGSLLLLRQDRLWIEAEAGVQEIQTAMARLCDTEDCLPQSLLSYVRRTREKVILADASAQNLFSEDAYFQRTKPKSVLCIPLSRQGKLIGMVYLENNLASNAFTADRIALLELLASQAAISLENATLYEELEQRVQERTQELRAAQAELVTTARQAGMAEIATNVLHNVGNALNSVNVSAGLIYRQVRESKSAGLARVVQLLNDHALDMGDFLTQDAKGKQLPLYLQKLVEALNTEQKNTLEELERMTKSIDHIKDIVATQQSYAGASRVLEQVQIGDLLEDALRMSSEALTRHHVSVKKEFAAIPPLPLDKHRVLQILLNLIANAKNAMEGVDAPHQITLQAEVTSAHTLKICVVDNGVGIPAENLTRIFSHGFTTRKDGHGFGLHSCVLAAQEMGGALKAYSEGVGKGATFTLELPLNIEETRE